MNKILLISFIFFLSASAFARVEFYGIGTNQENSKCEVEVKIDPQNPRKDTTQAWYSNNYISEHYFSHDRADDKIVFFKAKPFQLEVQASESGFSGGIWGGFGVQLIPTYYSLKGVFKLVTNDTGDVTVWASWSERKRRGFNEKCQIPKKNITFR
jgi:hypothetical protein